MPRHPSVSLLAVLALLVLTAIVLSSCGESELDSSAALADIERSYASGRYREAADACERLLRADTTNAAALRIRGLALYELKDWDASYTALLRARYFDPTTLDVRRRLGRLHLRREEKSEAWVEAEFLLANGERDFEALQILARAAGRRKEVSRALKELTDDEDLYVESAAYHVELGLLHLAEDNVAEAETAFTTALELDPQIAPAIVGLGNIALSRGDAEEAERRFRQAAELSPEEALPIQLAEFYLRRGDVTRARAYLSTLINDHPGTLSAVRLLIALALDRGDYDEAEALLQTLLEHHPRDRAALFFRAQIEVERGDLPKAIETLERVLELQPDHLPALYAIARAYMKTGRPGAARKRLNQALAIAPRFLQAILLKTELDIVTGEPGKAVPELERRTVAGLRSARAFELLGRAYMARAQFEKAAQAFQRSVDLAPHNPRGHYLHAVTLKQLGRLDLARTELERALELAPARVAPLRVLLEVLAATGDYSAALDRAQAAARHYPDSAAHAYLLGQAQRASGRDADSIDSYQRAIDLEPRLARAYAQLAAVAPEQYRSAIDRVMELVGEQSARELLMKIGYLHVREDGYEAARQIYEDMLTDKRWRIAAINNLASICSEQGDHDRARQLAATAAAEAPQNPTVADTLGWVSYRAGAYQEALRALTRSAELLDSPTVRYHLGMTYFKLSDHLAARKELSLALTTDELFLWTQEARNVRAALR